MWVSDAYYSALWSARGVMIGLYRFGDQFEGDQRTVSGNPEKDHTRPRGALRGGSAAICSYNYQELRAGLGSGCSEELVI